MLATILSFINFFGQAPHLPLFKIAEDFGPMEIIRAYCQFGKWEYVLMKLTHSFHCEKYIDVQIKLNVIIITCTFLNTDNDCFVLKFKSSDDYEKEIIMDHTISSQMITQPCHPYYNLHPDLISFCSNNSANLESLCLEMLDFVLKKFQPVTNCITVDDTVFSSQFVNNLLLALPQKWGRSLKLKAVNGNGENLVASETIGTLLKNTKFSESISIGGVMDKVLQSDKIQLKALSMQLPDARFLNYENLISMRFWDGEIGTNNLTSEDFNGFLQMWRNNNRNFLNTARFSINSEQKINLQEVVEGLQGISFDRRHRDRSCLFRGGWLDLKDGIDLYNGNGGPLTIHLTESHLYFIAWRNHRPLWDAKLLIEQKIESAEKTLTQCENDCLKLRTQMITATKTMKFQLKKAIRKIRKNMQLCENMMQNDLIELRKLEAIE